MDNNVVQVMVRFRGEEADQWRELCARYGGNTNAVRHLWRYECPYVQESKRKRGRLSGVSQMFRDCAAEGSVTLMTRLFNVSASGASMFCLRHDINLGFDRMARNTKAANRLRAQSQLGFLEKWSVIVSANPSEFPWPLRAGVDNTIATLREKASALC